MSSSKLMQLRVSLKNLKPEVWRRVLVPYEMTFKELHFVIQDLFEWSNTHLHKFNSKNKKTGQDIEIGDGCAFEFGDAEFLPETTRISDFFKKPKDTLEYEYDFGSPWYHNVMLEQMVFEAVPNMSPVCVAGKRTAPPEEDPGSDYDEFSEEGENFDPKEVIFKDYSHLEDIDPFEGLNLVPGFRKPKEIAEATPIEKLQVQQNMSSRQVYSYIHNKLITSNEKNVDKQDDEAEDDDDDDVDSPPVIRKRPHSPEESQPSVRSAQIAQNLMNQLENDEEDVEDTYGKYVSSQMRLIKDLTMRENLRIDIQKMIKKYRFGK